MSADAPLETAASLETAAPLQAAAVRACLFRLAGQAFAVDVQRVREVVVLEETTAVPLAPAHVVGVTNLRGQVLPVLDVRASLGLPPGRVGGGTPVLVVAAEGLRVGIAIDRALGLEAVEGVAPPAEPDRARLGRAAAGILERPGEPVTLLDLDALLAALGVAGADRGA